MIYNFITNLLGNYAPIVNTDPVTGSILTNINWGWVFDACALLGFSFLIFKVILIIVRGVFYK